MGAVVWKVLGTGSAILAAAVATRLVQAAWASVGRDIPKDPENPYETGWGEALTFAAASGLAMGVARVAASRKAAEYYTRSAGHPPKALTSKD
ncbi:MAG TPA: DUF4235 domain-containing protein [Candidatus Lustribacter sp.]|nr:DUF4235 domain-containing protein [Candidatus Lustribacter sp.]